MVDWIAPTELPDLRRVDLIAIDSETSDERLRADMGSGWPFRAGHMCGISVAFRADGDVRGLYLPIRHPDSQNFESEQVFQWVRDHVAAGVRFITQNGLYDWGWLRAEAGIKMPPSDRIEEIGALATLVDENRFKYSLDALCEWRGLPGKDNTLLRQGIEALKLVSNKRKKLIPQTYISQLPARYVGPYAEADAINTLLLHENLNPILNQEGTRAAYRLECDILPLVLEMRLRGIRVDLDAAERARDLLLHKRDVALTELSNQLGCAISMHEIQARKWLVETFDRHGIKYPRTEKGNPSFTAGKNGWMAVHQHWLPKLIAISNKYDKAAGDFAQKILDYAVNGRIHAEINPHRSEDNGTKSFRFSYSDPPLQQMPSRDEELAPLIRGIFLPEEGEVWAKPDASQQEFRFVVHYANQHKLIKAAQAVARYRDDPDTDFHALAAAFTELARSDAKAVNFGKIYGIGVKKFAAMLGKSLTEAQQIFDRYDRELPFLRQLSKLYSARAHAQGYIVLYDGARRHFDRWAPGGTWKKGAGPCELAEARQRIADPNHPWYRLRIYRADARNALNALIQGSAARHTKLWMRACWNAGIVPLLQMHDCLDCSVSSREQAELVAHLGEEAVKLDVPMRVDLKFGRTWGDAKHSWDELHQTAATERSQGSVRGRSAIPRPAEDECVGRQQRETVGATQHVAGRTSRLPEDDPARVAVAGGIREPLSAGVGPAGTGTGANRAPINGRRVEAAPIPTEPIPVPEHIVPEPEPESLEERLQKIPLADLIGEPLVYGKMCCPFHDDDTPSLHVYRDHYYCFGCGARGGHIEWLREAEGLSLDAAIDVIFGWQPSASPRQSQQENDTRTLKLALALWRAAKSIAGTPAIRYLAEVRGIDTSALPADVPLRFHPNCPFGKGQRLPCLLALYQDVESDEPAGIHRIALQPDVFASAQVERRSLGRWPRPRAIKLWPAAPILYLGEGIETVLAAATRLVYRDGAPMRPAWAAGSTGGISKFPVLPEVNELRLLLDHDDAGEACAALCLERWQEAGRKVLRLRPPKPGSDFNDVVLEKLRAVS